MPFGETVMGRWNFVERTNKRQEWVKGVFVGKEESTDAFLVSK